MTDVLAVANQKGGVAKTTTVHSLGVASAELGRRTLVVDLDPQACLTFSLGFDPDRLDGSLHDVFVRSAGVAEVTLAVPGVPGLDVLPATIDLAGSEVHLLTRTGREHVLARALEPVLDRYDLILIDCPPSLGVLTINGLTAARSVLIPLQCEALSHRGVGQLLETIEDVRAFANSGLTVRGVIATMYDDRTRHARHIFEEVEDRYRIPVLQPPVRKSIRFAEAPARGKSILQHAPNFPRGGGLPCPCRRVARTRRGGGFAELMATGSDPFGRHALFSAPERVEADGDPRATGATRAEPAGRRALFTDPSAGDEAAPARAARRDDSSAATGVLAVTCSTCGASARVGVVEFLTLQLPFGAWLPRRTFDRWMTCPVCRRRTWTSVTLAR